VAKVGRWTKRWKVALAVGATLVALVTVGLLWAWLRLGPPTARFPGWWVSRVVLGTGAKAVEITDRSTIDRYYCAASKAVYECDYATRCLADEHPDAYSVNFVLRSGHAFQIQLGVADDCGVIYCPSLNRTYGDRGGLMRLAADRMSWHVPYFDEPEATGGDTRQ
jgi:hypothetical protein